MKKGLCYLLVCSALAACGGGGSDSNSNTSSTATGNNSNTGTANNTKTVTMNVTSENLCGDELPNTNAVLVVHNDDMTTLSMHTPDSNGLISFTTESQQLTVSLASVSFYNSADEHSEFLVGRTLYKVDVGELNNGTWKTSDYRIGQCQIECQEREFVPDISQPLTEVEEYEYTVSAPANAGTSTFRGTVSLPTSHQICTYNGEYPRVTTKLTMQDGSTLAGVSTFESMSEQVSVKADHVGTELNLNLDINQNLALPSGGITVRTFLHSEQHGNASIINRDQTTSLTGDKFTQLDVYPDIEQLSEVSIDAYQYKFDYIDGLGEYLLMVSNYQEFSAAEIKSNFVGTTTDLKIPELSVDPNLSNIDQSYNSIWSVGLESIDLAEMHLSLENDNTPHRIFWLTIFPEGEDLDSFFEMDMDAILEQLNFEQHVFTEFDLYLTVADVEQTYANYIGTAWRQDSSLRRQQQEVRLIFSDLSIEQASSLSASNSSMLNRVRASYKEPSKLTPTKKATREMHLQQALQRNQK